MEKSLIQLLEIRKAKAFDCIRSLYIFFLTFWDVVSSDKLVDNWHIKYLCNELQALGIRLINREMDIPDLIINIPFGMSKSTIVSECFPVWLWLHAPNFSIITSSYSYGLSMDHSLRAKAIVKSDKFQELFQDYFLVRFGKRFELTKDTEDDWRNNFNGIRYATSTGGTVTGMHGHLIIRDDPINPEQAESKAYRDRCNRYNDRTLSSRKVDKDRTPTITIMQRLHEDDTTGHELAKKGKRIRHICLPGQLTEDVKPPEVAEFYIDGLLDPVRLSYSTIEKMKTDLGSYGFAGQILQTPIKVGGNIIKTEWIGTFQLSGLLAEVDTKRSGLAWMFTIDGAYTSDKNNDATAILCYAVWNNNLYIRDVAGVRLEMPELLKFIPEFCYRNGYNRNQSKIYIEPKANGLSVAQMIKRETPLNMVLDPPPKTDKVSRVMACIPFLESRRVFVLSEGAFVDEFLDELKIFPHGTNDDSVDVLTMAVLRVTGKAHNRAHQVWHLR